jgi:hypothetical protein
MADRIAVLNFHSATMYDSKPTAFLPAFLFLRCGHIFQYEDLSLCYISGNLLQKDLWRMSSYEINFQPPLYRLFCLQEVKIMLICRWENDLLGITEIHNLLFLSFETLRIIFVFPPLC